MILFKGQMYYIYISYMSQIGAIRVPANPDYTPVDGDVSVLGGTHSRGSSTRDKLHDNLPPEAGVSLLSWDQKTVDTAHPLVHANDPRVLSIASTALVTSSSMGEGSLHGGVFPGQGQVEGQQSDVEASGYG